MYYKFYSTLASRSFVHEQDLHVESWKKSCHTLLQEKKNTPLLQCNVDPNHVVEKPCQIRKH